MHRSILSSALMALALSFSGAAPSHAQAPTDAPFAAMSEDLTNPDKAFAYAEAAVAAGDIKGAIATLERMLVLYPTLDNLRLELGLLYYQAGRPDLARRYIDLALVGPDAPSSVRERADAYRRQADAQLDTRRFSLQAYVGAQYEENPSAAPESVLVQLGVRGRPLLISNIGNGDTDEDYAIVAALAGDARYALPGQSAHELALDALLYVSRYDDTAGLDATSFSLRAGPRLNFGRPLAPHTVVRPYLSAAVLGLDRDTYFNSYGAGATLLHRVSPAVTGTISASYEARVYSGAAERPRNSEQTGDYTNADVGLIWRALPFLQFNAGWAGELVDARLGYESRTRAGLRFSTTAFVRPFARAPGDLALTAGWAYRETLYGDPDPFVDAERKRREERTTLFAGVEAPITRRISLSLTGEDVRNRAPIPNYAYDNRIAALGLNIRF